MSNLEEQLCVSCGSTNEDFGCSKKLIRGQLLSILWQQQQVR